VLIPVSQVQRLMALRRHPHTTLLMACDFRKFLLQFSPIAASVHTKSDVTGWERGLLTERVVIGAEFDAFMLGCEWLQDDQESWHLGAIRAKAVDRGDVGAWRDAMPRNVPSVNRLSDKLHTTYADVARRREAVRLGCGNRR